MAMISGELAKLVRRFQVEQAKVDPCSGTNHEAFAEIFNTLQPLVREYAYRLTGDKDSAEDLTSEALVKLYQNVNCIDPQKTLSWTRKVVLNLFRSLWRKERRFYSIDSFPERDLVEAGREVSTSFQSDRVLEKIALRQSLADLPSFEKNIVAELSRGHSVADVAKHCGTHRVTIYRHISSIRRRLAQRLGGETVGGFRIPTAA
jgi:RNA polymerase sigma factor (sigma-70 family)